MVKNRLVLALFYFLLSMASLSVAQADQTDGHFYVAGAANNDLKLTCQCGPQTFSFTPDVSATGGNDFSMTKLYLAVQPFVDVPNNQCFITPNSNNAFFDLTTCTLTNNASTVTYADQVNIHAMGYHCFNPPGVTAKLGNCYGGWAVAGYINAAVVNPAIPYQTINQPVNNPQLPGTPCIWGVASPLCYNAWNITLQPKLMPGNITVLGAANLTARCTADSFVATARLSQLQDGNSVLDLQGLHDQLAPGNPSATVTAKCELLDPVLLVDYGSLQITGLNGVRNSAQHPSSTLWSTQVTIAAQPPAGHTLSNLQVAAGSDSDTTGQYHNLWTVQLAPSAAQNNNSN